MRLLLDELFLGVSCASCPGVDASHVLDEQWKGKSNGELLKLMQAAGFTVLVTVDQQIPFQQNLQHTGVAVVILVAASNRLADLRLLLPILLKALPSLAPGELRRVGGEHGNAADVRAGLAGAARAPHPGSNHEGRFAAPSHASFRPERTGRSSFPIRQVATGGTVRHLAIAVVMWIWPSGATAQTARIADTLGIIASSGVGTITLPPDQAVLQLTVESRATTAASAASTNNAAVERLLRALRSSSETQESVSVVAVSVSPDEDYQSGQLRGYSASATIRVVLRNLDRLAPTLDRSLSNGATGVGAITFASDREPMAKQEAIALAFQDARAKAEALARAAGVPLGPLVHLSVDPEAYYPGALAEAAVANFVTRATSMTPRGVQVRVTVHARWQLGQR